MPAILTLKNISKKFDEHSARSLSVLSRISLTIKAGEFFILLGPSGCGKSTLLRIIAGLDHDYTGSMTLAPDLTQAEMSFVFQQFALLPWLNVAQNVGLGLIAQGLPQTEIDARVDAELKLFDLKKFRTHLPHELSGGMRQRVGFARALVTNPAILFLDEPFSELDSYIATELRLLLLDIWSKRKLTIIMVSHNVEETLELADRIAVMTPRPGKIEHIVHNPLTRPRNPRTDAFFALEDILYNLVKP